jgi:predicted metal-dependent enzyme (double-stranded beta helix superfamily)
MHPDSSSPPAALARLCDSLRAARHLPPHGLLGAVAREVAQADPDPGKALQAARALGELGRSPARGGYSRHVAYADPYGHFTIVYLVWPPQQFSPVHGHRTWCAYRVLQGELTETLYRWDPAAQCAQPVREVARRPGDIVTAEAGLQQIHRLGNAGPDLAVSLHIYGVDAQSIATGVNHLVRGAPADLPPATACRAAARDDQPIH